VTDAPAVLWLDAIGEDDRGRVGGKAFVLARLKQRGFPVPQGFVLTAAAPVEAAVEAMRRLPGPVAVRSSSTAEDTDEVSFAGQYRTVLNVLGTAALREAVVACRDSAKAADGYTRAMGAGFGRMAVLVQQMVAPRAAGVAFTHDPRDASKRLVEAHAGLGEALVSGVVTPDRYIVDRATGALHEGPAEGSLDPAGLRAVVDLLRRVEDALGGPQDVEWALGKDGPALLQARPITVETEERADPRLRRITRANVGEVLPDPVTPLTASTVVAFLEYGFRGVAAAAGLLPKRAAPFLVLHRRRLYMNLSLSVEVAGRLPGVTAADAERLILGGGAAGEAPPLPAGAIPGLLFVGVRLLRLAGRLPGRVEAAETAVRELPDREAIAGADPLALGLHLERFEQLGRELAWTHVASSGSCGFRLALLGGVVGRFAPGDPAERVNRLVAGLEGVASSAPAFALEALAEDAAHQPDWTRWIARALSRADDVAVDLADAPPALGGHLRSFLERFGHRALSEGELRATTWEDDPRPLLAALLTLAEGERNAEWSRRARAEIRGADEAALNARLGPLRRAVLRSALHGARSAVVERERTKSLTIALVHHGRRLVRAAARHLLACGQLVRPDDVFFLDLPELLRALRGVAPSRARVERRRRRQEREGALEAPRLVDLAGGDPPAESGGRGIGVSAGVGVGRARVIAPGQVPHLEPGEILVASVLDAAFGPLLASAAGAVAEIGGLLSHGAVVARELGVPCVVDVRDATRRFQTGQRLLVDGGLGTVTALPAAETTTALKPTGDEATPEGAMAGAPPAALAAEDGSRESVHALTAHPLARESVYLNVQDPRSGTVLVASVGHRPGGRGESLIALGTPEGQVLFGLDRARAEPSGGGLAVAGQEVLFGPFRFRATTRLSPHEPSSFPPGLLPLVLSPRTVDLSVDLTLEATTPLVDFCRGLPAETLAALGPLGAHHLEESGRWRGELRIDGRRIVFDGTGSRDHSWGQRSWDAADHWRLFTVRFGDDLAVHALAVSVRGRLIEGGFLWRGGRAERITRVQYVTDGGASALRSFELRVTTAAGVPLRLTGRVMRSITVPVDVEPRPGRHLRGRPYRLLLHENFTRYEALGRIGHGMAELTERPLPGALA
jgi:rifampicin phosphotransferase